MTARVLKLIQILWLAWPTWCVLEEECGWRFQKDHPYVCFTPKHWSTSKRSTFQHPPHIWALASATYEYSAENHFCSVKNVIDLEKLCLMPFFSRRSKDGLCNQSAHLPGSVVGGDSPGRYCHPAGAQTRGHSQNNRWATIEPHK